MNESTVSTKSYNLLNFSSSIDEMARDTLTVSPKAADESLSNNPFDLVVKKVEQCGDGFESPVANHIVGGNGSAGKVGKLIDLWESPTDKENKNEINTKAKSISPQARTRVSKRDNLLKMSVVNQAAKSGGDNPQLNKFSERWRNILTHDDSMQDIMKQELNLVDSFDTDSSDYESDLKIPMLKEAKSNEVSGEKDRMASIIEKLNEIKENSTRKTDELKCVANKLKEVGSNGNKEIDDLVNKLCVALDKSDSCETDVSPVPIVRQGTFDLDEPSPELMRNPSHEIDVQSVVDQVTKALGNVNLGNVNVISSDETQSQIAPTIIVVVNQNDHPAYEPECDITPPKKPGRFSQMFKSAKASYSETPRASNVRRSVSFNTPAPPTPSSRVQPPTPSTHTLPTRRRSLVQEIQPIPAGAPPRKTFMERIKPKFGILKKTNGTNEKKEKGPMKATVPLKSVIKTAAPAQVPSEKPPPTPSRLSVRPSPSMQRRSVGPQPEPSPVMPRTPRATVNLRNRKSLLPPSSTTGSAASNPNRRSLIATPTHKTVKK